MSAMLGYNKAAVMALILGLPLSTCLSIDKPQQLNLPKLDFSQIGDVLIAGNFKGFTERTYSGQEDILKSPQTDRDDIIISYGDNIYTEQTFANGLIDQQCVIDDVWFITGNYTSLWNTSVPSGIAAVDLQSMSAYDLTETFNLGESLLGSDIRTMWCNQSEIYFGGKFQLNDTWGVAKYNTDTREWSRPAFAGFAANSSIETIIPYNDNLVFGGNFSGLVPWTTLQRYSGNDTQANQSLLQPGMQPVSFKLANATGHDDTNGSSYNASTILCPLDPGQGWGSDISGSSGSINVTLAYMLEPSMIRIYNLADGSGTQQFRIISQPAGSHMNLTYRDESGELKFCASECPLPEYEDSVRYTDFEFVNTVPTTSLEIQLLQFYGNHAGLKGIELFENGQFVFANNKLNSPRVCNVSATNGAKLSSTSQLNGADWTSVNDFMSTTISNRTSLDDTNITFSPALDAYQIERSVFEVLIYTPGCRAYNTCSQRGQVNVTVHPGIGQSQSTILYQTNEEIKYDVVYNGTLASGAYITLSPISNSELPQNMVAYKASLRYVGSKPNLNVSSVFEYAPANFTKPLSSHIDGVINSFGPVLGSNASVNALLLNGKSSLFVGGSGFSSNVSNSNLLSVPLTKDSAFRIFKLHNSSETITSLVKLDTTSVVLTSEHAYQVTNYTISDTHMGVVSSPMPITVNNSRFWMFSPQTADQGAYLLDPRSGKFISTESTSPTIYGRLTGAINFANVSVLTGSISVQGETTAGNSVVLGSSSSSGIVPYAMANDEVSVAKRDTDDVIATKNVVTDGTYISPQNRVIVGQFSAVLNNGTTIHNAIQIFSSSSVSNASSIPAVESLPSTSRFNCVEYYNQSLVLGGSFRGELNGSTVNGLLLYETSSSGALSLASHQPPTLSDGTVKINAVAFPPNSTNFLVGGEFNATSPAVTNGSCNGLCLYNAKDRQWQSLSGASFQPRTTIKSLVFQTGDRLLIAGQLYAANEDQHQIAVYDFANQTTTYLPDPSISGSVNQLVVFSNTPNDLQFVVATDTQLAYYNNSSWTSFPANPVQSGSVISSLSVVALQNSTQSSSSNNNTFSAQKALLVAGDLRTNDGNVSVVVYDGHTWNSLYVASSDLTSQSGPVLSAIFAQYGGKLNGGATTSSNKSAATSDTAFSRHVMPVGHVVGIACAISIGCVMLLTAVYMAFEWFMNRKDHNAYQALAQNKPESDPFSSSMTIKQ